MRYVVGIDRSGTSCRAAMAAREGRILGWTVSGLAATDAECLGECYRKKLTPPLGDALDGAVMLAVSCAGALGGTADG